MEIVLGKMAGFCGGVRNAVNKTYKEAESNNKTIYCLGDLVHNPVVLSNLEALGVKIINSLELPKDLMLGAAIVTATGRHEVLISNYKGILEYEDSFIKIQTKNCRILISGSHLAIDYYTNEEMKIVGLIDSVSYEY